MPNAKTILLVDDDLDDVQFFEEALVEEAGGMVILDIVYNGFELLKKLERSPQRPDLIFLDINMPGMNGLECLRKIRDRNEWNDIKVIMHSTTNEAAAIKKSYKLGANLYVVKAADFNIIRQIIRKCLYYDWNGPDFYDQNLKRPNN